MKAVLAVMLIALTGCGNTGSLSSDFRKIPIRGVSAGDSFPATEGKLKSEFSSVECLEDEVYVGSARNQLWRCRASGQNDSLAVIFNKDGSVWNIRYSTKIDHGNSSACEKALSTTKDEILSRYGPPDRVALKVMMYGKSPDTFSADISCNDYSGAVGGPLLHVSLVLNVFSIMDSQPDRSNGEKPNF